MFFWSRTTRWRWLLALYPVAMGLSLVYLGEHYAFDVLLGWIYAVVVFVLGNRLYDAWSARSAARRAHGATSPEPEPEARNR
jgi:membrane-associated phospholipid phosphatase